MGLICIATGTSVLDLGCAAGRLLIEARGWSGVGGRLVGVELVHGWVAAATEYATPKYDIRFVEADITDVHLGETFDVITMADSMEHIPLFRLRALWGALREHAHPGTAVYVHVPSPERQRRTASGKGGAQQHYEEVVDYDALRAMARCVGFEVVQLDEHPDDRGGYASIVLKAAFTS